MFNLKHVPKPVKNVFFIYCFSYLFISKAKSSLSQHFIDSLIIHEFCPELDYF